MLPTVGTDKAVKIKKLVCIRSRDAGTGGGQEGQLPALPFAGRGKGGKSAL